MERIEVIKRNEKQILCFNLSDIKSNLELEDVVKNAKDSIKAFPPCSVYTVTDISRIVFDTKTKEIAADWMAFNKPYVINAAFAGVAGVRKIMMNMVFALSGRTNVKLFGDTAQAIEWIESL